MSVSVLLSIYHLLLLWLLTVSVFPGKIFR